MYYAQRMAKANYQLNFCGASIFFEHPSESVFIASTAKNFTIVLLHFIFFFVFNDKINSIKERSKSLQVYRVYGMSSIET